MSEESTPWDRLFAHPQRTTCGMMERNTLYPVSHCIYQQREDGKYERLCDHNFAGNHIPDVRDEPPFDVPPISEGWDDRTLLGEGYSCSECAQKARLLSTDTDQ